MRHDGEELVVFSLPLESSTPDSALGSLAEVLTAAQRDVAARVLEGASNAEIARARGSSPATVAKQLERIYRRLGINSRRELAALAGARQSARRTGG